ncbi:MAG: hypothetical protein WD063_05680, partial [Pirellulales bacterium]
NTGLAASNIFFFGNRIGDDFIGTPGMTFLTDVNDEADARAHPGFLQPLVNSYDYNKDGRVNAADQIIARGNAGSMLRINITSPPAVPGPSGEDGSGPAVASALATLGASSNAASEVSAGNDRPAAMREPDSAPVGRFWQQLGEASDPRASIVLDSLDQIVETLDLDEWVDGTMRRREF